VRNSPLQIDQETDTRDEDTMTDRTSHPGRDASTVVPVAAPEAAQQAPSAPAAPVVGERALLDTLGGGCRCCG
jgi:hypothetical protein